MNNIPGLEILNDSQEKPKKDGVPEGLEIIDPKIEESFGKSVLRTLNQLPLGLASAATYPLEIAKFLAVSESLNDFEDVKNLGTPEQQQAYLQAVENVAKYAPSQSSLENYLEDKGYPVKPKTKIQKGARLAGEAAGFKTGGLTQKVMAGLGASATSAGLQIVGIPETVSNTLGFLASGVNTEGLGKISNPEVKQLVSNARELGFTDAQIAPLIQSPTKRKYLINLAQKGEKSEAVFRDVYNALSDSYAMLAKSERAQAVYSAAEKSDILQKLSNTFETLPSEAIKKIGADFEALSKGELTPAKLINFYQDVNYNIFKGEKILTPIKNPIKDSIENKFPELGKDFETTNKLYGDYAEIRKKFKPTMLDQFVGKAETMAGVGATGAAIFTGNFGALMTLVGEKAARILAREMLLNPNMYNLSNKIVSSLEKGSVKTAQNSFKALTEIIRKKQPEIANQLEILDLEELFSEKKKA